MPRLWPFLLALCLCCLVGDDTTTAQQPPEDACMALLATLAAARSETRLYVVEGAEYGELRTQLETSDDTEPAGFVRRIQLGPDASAGTGYERFSCENGVISLSELVLSGSIVERFEPPLPVLPLPTADTSTEWSWSGTYIAVDSERERQYSATAQARLEGRQEIETPAGEIACTEVRIEVALMMDTAIARWALAYCTEPTSEGGRLVRRRVTHAADPDRGAETWVWAR